MNKNMLKSPSYLVAASILLSGALHAQVYWDTNDTIAGSGATADGTWDAATATNWTSDSTGASATTVYTGGSDVVFAAGSDLSTAEVTVSGTQTVSSLTFEEGSVTLSGSDLDDAGSTVNVTVADGASVTMNSRGSFNANFDVQGSGTFYASRIDGGSVMTKIGTGTATFDRLDAILTVNEGTVIYTGLGGAKLKNTTVNSGGTLRLNGNAFDGTKRNLTVNTGGQVELANGLEQTISLFNGAGSVVGGSGSALKVGGDNKTTTFDGSVSGGMDLYSIGSGSFTLSDTSSLEFVIEANGESNSLLGDDTNDTTTNLDGEFTFDLTGADLTAGNSWVIVNVAALNETYGATFSILEFTESDGIWTYDLNALVQFSELTGGLVVVPESSTYALLAGCLSLGFVMLKRRQV